MAFVPVLFHAPFKSDDVSNSRLKAYLHDCRLIDKDLYATELAKRPAPLALHHALKAARNSLVPTHALVRPYGAELSLLIDYLLAYPLKLNNKGNYGYARSDKRQKIQSFVIKRTVI